MDANSIWENIIINKLEFDVSDTIFQQFFFKYTHLQIFWVVDLDYDSNKPFFVYR